MTAIPLSSLKPREHLSTNQYVSNACSIHVITFRGDIFDFFARCLGHVPQHCKYSKASEETRHAIDRTGKEYISDKPKS